MKRFLILSLCWMLLWSCTSYPEAEDPLDAAREFVDACLKGDFDKAASYMLEDNENQNQLEKLESTYEAKSDEEKEAYQDANIIILEIDAVSDTVHIINYKNSFDNIARKAKVIQRDGKWQVDLKYTFDGNL